MYFFGGHGFGFNNELYPIVLGYLQNILTHSLWAVGAEHLGPSGFGIFSELGGQLLHMLGSIALARGNLAAQGLKVGIFVDFGAVHLVVYGKLAQGSAEFGVIQGRADGFSKLLFHYATPPISSTQQTTSRLGPCTPMVSTRSISAVRLGPVIMAM